MRLDDGINAIRNKMYSIHRVRAAPGKLPVSSAAILYFYRARP
jgi:hypothetical protein